MFVTLPYDRINKDEPITVESYQKENLYNYQNQITNVPTIESLYATQQQPDIERQYYRDEASLYDSDMDAEPTTFYERFFDTSDLTYKERIVGFLSCTIIGWILSINSASGFFSLVYNFPHFVLQFTLGNILSQCSTQFLSGPRRGYKNMFAKHRKYIMLLYLTSMLSCIICSLQQEKIYGIERTSYTFGRLQKFILFFSICLQFISMALYYLSFFSWLIPFIY